jgi:phenylalanyl-tRNA synthetase beta chain
MLEYGQPMHTYDYDKIEGSSLTLRQAEDGETIVTLDGEERELKSGMLVNEDDKKIVGIAGIMGAKNSEVTNKTKNILLQVENFEMYSIRRATRELGLRTEASKRFEKGLDPNLVDITIHRGIEMLSDITGGEIASKIIDIYPEEDKPIKIYFETKKVKSRLGIDIEKEEIKNILTKLGLKIIKDEELEEDGSSKLTLEIPTFRRDLNIEEDLLEEIVRIYGYHNIPFSLPERDLTPNVKNKRFEIERKLTRNLIETGSQEIYSYAFVGEELYNKARLDIDNNIKLKNPLSPELMYYRNTILPSIIEKSVNNQNNFNKQDLFEISKIAVNKVDQDTGIYLQPKLIAGLLAGDEEKRKNELFRKLKGKINFALNEIGIKDIRYDNLNNQKPFSKAKIFHPNKSALLYIDDIQIGIAGYLHPEVIDNFEIDLITVGYELNFDLLAENTSKKTNYTPVSNLPEVRRSLSAWFNDTLEIREIKNKILELNIDILKSILITDIYKKDDKDDKKSISIEFKLQSDTHTLEEDEINSVMEEIQNKLISSFNANLRTE